MVARCYKENVRHAHVDKIWRPVKNNAGFRYFQNVFAANAVSKMGGGIVHDDQPDGFLDNEVKDMEEMESMMAANLSVSSDSEPSATPPIYDMGLVTDSSAMATVVDSSDEMGTYSSSEIESFEMTDNSEAETLQLTICHWGELSRRMDFVIEAEALLVLQPSLHSVFPNF